MKPTGVFKKPMQAPSMKPPMKMFDLHGINWWPKVQPHVHYSVGPLFALSCLGLGIAFVHYNVEPHKPKLSGTDDDEMLIAT